jgi:hypothetical protein
LVDQEGTPQADIWQFLWNDIKRADMFISHPIPSVVPNNVPKAKVAHMPSVASSITALRILKIEAVTVQVFGHFPPK